MSAGDYPNWKLWNWNTDTTNANQGSAVKPLTTDHTFTFDTPNISIFEDPLYWYNTKIEYKTKKKKKRKSMARDPKDIPLCERDRIWLAKIFKGSDTIPKIPKTVYEKLWAHGLITISLTEQGEAEGFFEAMTEDRKRK